MHHRTFLPHHTKPQHILLTPLALAFFTLVFLALFATACTPQERVIVAQAPQGDYDDGAGSDDAVPVLDIPDGAANDTEGSASPPPEENTSGNGSDASLFPIRNSNETELVREKRYGTLLDLTNITLDDCTIKENELQLELEKTRESLQGFDERIAQAQQTVQDELRKDEALQDNEDAAPAQITRQKENVKEAERVYESKKLEQREAVRRERDLLDTIKTLRQECVQLQAQERKEELNKRYN